MGDDGKRVISMKLLKERGQSTVEYILLFAVVASLAYTILGSSDFTRVFGPDGVVATKYRNQLEYGYRHGLSLDQGGGNTPNYSNGEHDTYNSRFFGAADPYPVP